jgi:hypothetical protein
VIAAQPIQLVVFEGAPPSLGQVAQRNVQLGGPCCFLCVLPPGEDSGPVKRAWSFSVQPLDPGLCLFIIHAHRGGTFDAIVEFASELAAPRGAELDILFLSEDASWRGSRRLARELKGLQAKLGKVVPNCLVRRV